MPCPSLKYIQTIQLVRLFIFIKQINTFYWKYIQKTKTEYFYLLRNNTNKENKNNNRHTKHKKKKVYFFCACSVSV